MSIDSFHPDLIAEDVLPSRFQREHEEQAARERAEWLAGRSFLQRHDPRRYGACGEPSALVFPGGEILAGGMGGWGLMVPKLRIYWFLGEWEPPRPIQRAVMAIWGIRLP